jgi:hypothetical protein
MAEIPEDSKASEIFFNDLAYASIELKTKVFPVPPGASKKKSL